MKITTAVFPVGGLGTRFLPATKSMPKEMLTVMKKPIIHYAFEEAMSAGIERFIFVTGRNKSAINNYFDRAYEVESSLNSQRKLEELEKVTGWLPEPGNIAFIRQSAPLGLGHAIWCARNFVSESFVVILADELFLEKKRGETLIRMIEIHEKNNCSAVVGVDEIMPEHCHKYGILKIDGNSCESGRMLDAIEKPSQDKAPSNLAVVGRYVLNSKIFDYIGGKSHSGEIQITDALSRMCKESQVQYKKIDCQRFDCGNLSGYFEANIAFALNDKDFCDEARSVLKKFGE